MAKGFHQVPGFDFNDNYSPIIKPITIQLVLTLAISSHWTMRQLDFNNAFLNGILKKNVYKAQPFGFIYTTRPNWVYKASSCFIWSQESP